MSIPSIRIDDRSGRGTSRVRSSLAVFAILVATLATGCGPNDINRTYGQRRTAQGSNSVNGTAALASLFEQQGYHVTTWRRLSPRLNTFQVLVWTPDAFELPSPEERMFLDNWLASGTGRTLIYIGRDFDAGPLYWEKVEKLAPADQQSQVAAKRNEALSEHHGWRSGMPQQQYTRWFATKKLAESRRVSNLKGPWAQGIDAAKADIYVGTDLEAPTDELRQKAEADRAAQTAGQPKAATAGAPGPMRQRKKKELDEEPVIYEPSFLPKFEKLLESDRGETLVARVTQDDVPAYGSTWNGNQIIVVNNGSFLLNMPLVNHEHRKLAMRLVQSCGEPGKAAFLESDGSGLETFHSEPEQQQPTGAEMFAIYPINAILLHAISLGVLFCFARLPIFGRPWSLPSDATSDFGAHITAVAKFLERAGDREHARRQLKYYQEVVKGGATAANSSQPGRKPAPQPSSESSQ